MRRSPRLLAVLASAAISGVAPFPAHAQLRDVAADLGLPASARSWEVQAGDLDGDGDADLVVGYHDSVTFYRNDVPGLTELFTRDGDDPHGCAIDDVDVDGLGDVYCTRGAGRGTLQKANALWMQETPGGFHDRAAPFGVTDPWGRGRRTTFVDLNQDAFPDLFVGNGFPRADDRRSPNRTYVNDGGTSFTRVNLGISEEIGAVCVQRIDQNEDGWEDLLLCGSRRLHLYRRTPGGDFVDVAPRWATDVRRPRGAAIADMDLDGHPDLVTLTRSRIRVHPGTSRAGFGAPAYRAHVRAGRWVVVGNIGGGPKPEIFVVETCDDGGDVGDLLLRPRPHRLGYRRVRLAPAAGGCGDVAAAADLDGDQRLEVVVLNGRPGRGAGPVQVLAARWLGS